MTGLLSRRRRPTILLRTPALFKECFHLSEVQRAVAPCCDESAGGAHCSSSTAIFGRYAPSYGVALRFTSRAIVLGCLRSAAAICGRRKPVMPQRSNLISFLRRQLSINHRPGMSHLLS